MEEETNVLRPEEMVPYVREYLGLLEEIKVLEDEIKRCFMEYKNTREKLMSKKKPMDERFNNIEEVIKRTIYTQKLPGVKYKNYIFTLEEKIMYKRPEDKIAEALERNPMEQFTNDKKTLARLIAAAVKKKCKRTSNGERNDYKVMALRIRNLQ